MCRPQSAVSTPAGVRAPSQVVPLMPGWRQDAPWPPLLSLLACDFHVGSGWCTGIYEEAGHTEEGGGSRVNRAERDNCHKIPWCLNTALQRHLNLEKLQPVTHLPMILSLCLRTRHWLPSHGGKRPPPQTHTHTHARTHTHTCAHAGTTSISMPPHQPGRRTCPPQGLCGSCPLAGPRPLHTTPPLRHDCSARPAWTLFQRLTTPCPRRSPNVSATTPTSHTVLGPPVSPQTHSHLEPCDPFWREGLQMYTVRARSCGGGGLQRKRGHRHREGAVW